MKETKQLRKLMEAVETPYTEVKTEVKEDWGSSDWYPIMKQIDAAIAQYGLSPDTIQDAANEAADFYHDSMGYDDVDDAQEAIIDHWKRTSETGQRLMRMFAPVDETVTERQSIVQAPQQYDIAMGDAGLTIYSKGGKPELELSLDNFIEMVSKFNRQFRGKR